MILNILIEPDELLHKVANNIDVNEIKSEKIQQLIANLKETMRSQDNGAGIAATQVGELAQVCIIEKEFTTEKNDDLVLINPQWQKASILRGWDEEGCFSVPGIYGRVKRYKKIKVQALDENGNKMEFIADNFLARIIQHEVDHLNGILFIEKAKDLHKYEKEIM